MKPKKLMLLIFFEIAFLGAATLVVFGALAYYYDRTKAAIAERTIVAEETEVYLAFLTALPPTNTPTPTRTATPTSTSAPSLAPSASVSPAASRSLAPTRTPAVGVDPSISRTPTIAPPPPVPPGGGPPRIPAPGAWQTLSSCGGIGSPGNYRLGADLTAEVDCFRIQTSYVVLDCAGHSIRGTGFGGFGIAILKYGILNSQSPGYVELRNCRVSNFRYGIFAESGHHLVIHDNNSSNNYDDVDPNTRYGNFLGNADGGGIRVNNISDSYLYGNTTLHQAIGIDVRTSSGVYVRNNTSSGNSAWGINLHGTVNSEVSGNATADNIRRCTWGAGEVGLGCDAGGIVLQWGSSNNTVSNNQVTGQNGNGIFIKAHAVPCGNNNSIIGNTISSVMYNAVELGFCTGNKVNNNTIKEGLDGIWLGFGRETEIKNNTITDMLNHGIISSNSWNNTVSGNQVVNSNEGLYFYSENYDTAAYKWLPAGDYRSHDNCLCGNSLLKNLTTGVRLRDSTYNQVTNNVFQGNGRPVIVSGNTTGTSLQGNIISWVPFPLNQWIARR